ncbi:hypothetical protein MGU_11002 [Metarhizium guizhouense ARSEF 977]|uniref:Uncharacterized protein n=1 Tax=Metarhizium guizhouense (strain ARSEF 977) TaxID=1276136 RepID=A0A0B4HQD5_METGA|nr:hypothetical protein MGU_11002 [Metarhizium guizhouense ARSEF 977]
MAHATSPVECVNLPSQATIALNHSRYTITRPVITIERNGNDCFISAIFQLELGSTGTVGRHDYLFRSVELIYNHVRGENPRANPVTSAQSWTVTDSRMRTFSLGVTAGGPPPVANVSANLTWNKTITLEQKCDAWGVGAGPRGNNTSYGWLWTSSVRDDGTGLPNPIPPELHNNVSWCVEVRRQVNANDNNAIRDVLNRPFRFDISIQMYRKGRKAAGKVRKWIKDNYYHQCPTEVGQFAIGGFRGHNLSTDVGIPAGETISVTTALTKIRTTPHPGDNHVTIPEVFPDDPTPHPGHFLAVDPAQPAHLPMLSVTDLSKDQNFQPQEL